MSETDSGEGIDFSDPAVQAWLQQQWYAQYGDGGNPNTDPALPEWTNSNGGGYQPADIGSQLNEVALLEDRNRMSMDPLWAAVMGQISPDAMQSSYETEVSQEAVTAGKDQLRKVFDSSAEGSAYRVMAGALLDGQSAQEATDLASSMGLIAAPKPMTDADGQPMTSGASGAVTYDTSAMDSARKWATDAWQLQMSDVEEISKQVEIPSELAQKFKDAGYQSDPTQQYTANYLDPQLATDRSRSDTLGAERARLEQVRDRGRQRGDTGFKQFESTIGSPWEKGERTDPTMFDDQDFGPEYKALMQRKEAYDFQKSNPQFYDESLWGSNRPSDVNLTHAKNRYLTSQRTKRDDLDHQRTVDARMAGGRATAAAQQDRMNQGRANVAAMMLQAQGRTPFRDEYNARMGR